MQLIETVVCDDQILAYILRANITSAQTIFMTPHDLNVQLGFIVYPKGGEISRHTHKAINRQIIGTFEVIIVRRGRCEVDIYNDACEIVGTFELLAGDTIFMIGHGHGFRMLEDTILLEIKQGPYFSDEKQRF